MPKPTVPAEPVVPLHQEDDHAKPETPPKANRGGARPGAGRPKGQGRWGEPTTTLRVPVSQVPVLRAWLDDLAAAAVDSALPSPAAWAAAGLQCVRPAWMTPVLPLVLYSDRIAAGFPSPADDYADERIDLNRHLIRHKEATFFLRVQGDSMLGAGIHDGDLLIVDRALSPTDGKVVIAALDGELTVKRLSVRGESVRLLPENPAYPAIEIQPEQDLVIWGVVTSVIHALG